MAPGVSEWGGVRVSQLLREGGDGSDFALVLTALLHSIGTRVRLAHICLPPSSDGAGAATSEADAALERERRCRLVAEARVGFHPGSAAEWVGDRHAAGAGALGHAPPLLHFRREESGATWLSLAWSPAAGDGTAADGGGVAAEQQPGRAYLPAAANAADAEWTTFYPFDEHGCKWHRGGAEVDSSGRAHGSPAVARVLAVPPLAMDTDGGL